MKSSSSDPPTTRIDRRKHGCLERELRESAEGRGKPQDDRGAPRPSRSRTATHEDSPPIASKRFPNPLVPLDVRRELPLPEVPSGLRRIGLPTTVTVPEAAVNEDRGAPARKHDVRRTGKATDVGTKPVASRVQRTPNSQLRLRVRAADAAHHRAPLLRRHDVRHPRSPSTSVGMETSVTQHLHAVSSASAPLYSSPSSARRRENASDREPHLPSRTTTLTAPGEKPLLSHKRGGRMGLNRALSYDWFSNNANDGKEIQTHGAQ